MRKITVVGAGGTGCCTAAELTLMGNRVTLCEQEGWCEENLAAIRTRGGFELTGLATTGFAEIAELTHDFEKAVSGAEVIFVTALSTRHEALAEAMVPYLRDGQTILFSAGSCGSIILRRVMAEKGCTADIAVGELEGNMFPCRIRPNATGFIGMPGGKPKTIAAFPAKDTEKLCAVIGEFYKCIAAVNVFETTLNASNIIVHLGGSILNTGAVETTENFCFYDQGLTPSVLKVIETLGNERDAISHKLGYTVRSSVGFMKELADKERFPQFNGFRGLEGPLTMQDRYIFEDAQNGATFLHSLAETIGLSAPLARAFVTIASTINGTDYYASGRTMEKLGMAGMSVEQINRYLQEGTL